MPAPTEADIMQYRSIPLDMKVVFIKEYFLGKSSINHIADALNVDSRTTGVIKRCCGSYAEDGKTSDIGYLRKKSITAITDQDIIDYLNQYPTGSTFKQFEDFFRKRDMQNRKRSANNYNDPFSSDDSSDDFDNEFDDFYDNDSGFFGNTDDQTEGFSLSSIFNKIGGLFKKDGNRTGSKAEFIIPIIIVAGILIYYFRYEILALLTYALYIVIALAVLIFAFKLATSGFGKTNTKARRSQAYSRNAERSAPELPGIIGGVLLIIIGIGGFKNGAANNLGSTIFGVLLILGGIACLRGGKKK